MTDFLPDAQRCGIPDLGALNESLLVAFEVDALESARTIWINRRWLLQAGIDACDPGIHAALCRDICREFAVISRRTKRGNDGARGNVYFADRYGATGGCPHGGSGRTGIKGSYNAKGIGRTPLCPDTVAASYSSGLLSLKEALRETVAAEVAGAELPHGSIPIVAIIDTGGNFTVEKGGETQRAAIVVRPNFIRPAHFERSLFFGSAGTPDSDQYLDSLRVEAMVRVASDSALRSKIGFVTLEKMFLTFAQQLGASRALRLWSGRFLTSNISVTGALVDFGSFRAVSSWRRAYGVTSEAFGDEAPALRRSLDSLCHYFKKYGATGVQAPNPAELYGQIDKTIHNAFTRSLLSGLGVSACEGTKFANDLQRLAWDYYLMQQQQRVKVDKPADWRRSWIFDLLRKDHRTEYESSIEETKLARSLQALLLHESGRAGYGYVPGAARRWFRPRQRLYYDLASARAARVERLATSGHEVSAAAIDEYVNGEISLTRRHWPMLPSRLEVLGQVSEQYCAALYCFDRASRRHAIWLEAAVSGELCYVFQTKLCIADIKQPLFDSSGATVGFEPSVVELDPRAGAVVAVGSARVAVPGPRIRY